LGVELIEHSPYPPCAEGVQQGLSYTHLSYASPLKGVCIKAPHTLTQSSRIACPPQRGCGGGGLEEAGVRRSPGTGLSVNTRQCVVASCCLGITMPERPPPHTPRTLRPHCTPNTHYLVIRIAPLRGYGGLMPIHACPRHRPATYTAVWWGPVAWVARFVRASPSPSHPDVCETGYIHYSLTHHAPHLLNEGTGGPRSRRTLSPGTGHAPHGPVCGRPVAWVSCRTRFPCNPHVRRACSKAFHTPTRSSRIASLRGMGRLEPMHTCPRHRICTAQMCVVASCAWVGRARTPPLQPSYPNVYAAPHP
jgi:hypothetical protein